MFIILGLLYFIFLIIFFLGPPTLVVWLLVRMFNKRRGKKQAAPINLSVTKLPGVRPAIDPLQLRHLLLAGAAYAIGLLAWYLYEPVSIGAQTLFGTAVLHVATFALMHAFNRPIKREAYIISTLSLAFAAMITLRASDVLTSLNIMALLILNGALVLNLAGYELGKSRLIGYVASLVSWVYGLVGFVGFLSAWRKRRRARAGQTQHARKPWMTVERAVGVSLALPLLLIFGALFASADSRFADILPSLSLDWDLSSLESIGPAVITTALVGTTLFFILFYLTSVAPNTFATKTTDLKPFLPLASARIVLYSLISLFAVFALLQIPIIFGVESNSTDVNLAENARSGFYQLLFAAGFVLATISFLTSTTRGLLESSGSRLLAICWIGLTQIVLLSAFRRLFDYDREFGYTLIRFFSYGCMILIAVWLLAYAVRLARRLSAVWYAQVVVISAIVWLLAMNVVNPELSIARTNIDRSGSSSNRELDIDYIVNLSPDAWPAIFDAMDNGTLSSDETREAVSRICRKYIIGDHNRSWQNNDIEHWQRHSSDWRAWNASHAWMYREVDQRYSSQNCTEFIRR